jgi:transcriptional regulator with XRE-family HTH domain
MALGHEPQADLLNVGGATLGRRISLARHVAGLTQGQVADAVPCSRPLISKWEHGATIPDFYQAVRLTEILGVSLDYFANSIPADYDGSAEYRAHAARVIKLADRPARTKNPAQPATPKRRKAPQRGGKGTAADRARSRWSPGGIRYTETNQYQPGTSGRATSTSSHTPRQHGQPGDNPGHPGA